MKTTTFKEQGQNLPIGKIVKGEIRREISYRTPTAKTDRYLNIWREAHKGEHIGLEVCKYLSLIVDSACGEAYSLDTTGNSTDETVNRFLQWPYGDVMYAYMYARIAFVSEWMELGYICPTCGYTGTVEVDLWGTSVDVLENKADLICEVELVDGIKLENGGRPCKGLTLKPAPFLAFTLPGALMEKTDTLGYNQIRESIVAVKGAVDESHVLTDSELDSMSKRDMLRLDRLSGSVSAGPRMRTPIDCQGKLPDGKPCHAKMLNGIDWRYDYFFDSSIPLKRLTA